MSDVQSSAPNVGGTQPILGDGWVQLGGPQSKKIFLDQLSPSDQEMLIQYFLTAQTPQLTPPEQVFSSSGSKTSAVESAEDVAYTQAYIRKMGNYDMVMDMLEAWITSIQVQADKNKKDSEIKEIERKEIEKQDLQRMAVALDTYKKTDYKDDPNFALFAVGMIITGTAMLQATLPVVDSGPMSFNPVVDMYSKTAIPTIADMNAQLALVGGLYAAGVQYFTLAQIASESANAQNQPKDAAFAKGYAENMVALVVSPTFNSYLTAIVTRGIPETEALSEENITETSSMLKVVLLASALGMLYKMEAGKMTGLEFMGMLNGNIKFGKDDIRSKLITLINANLAGITTPGLKDTVLASLQSYFDSDPHIDTLADPAKVFVGIYRTLPRGDLSG